MKKSIIVLATLSLGGCALGNDVTFENNRNTTVGQELVDLKNAYDEKIITLEEYDKLKQDIKASALFNIKVEGE